MPLVGHGADNTNSRDRKGKLAATQSDQSTNHGNTQKESTDSPFRGFAKVPTVVLSRHDISPYLTKMSTSQQIESSSRSPIDLPSSTIDDRFFNCRVKMFRDDLEKMKETAALPLRRFTCKVCKKTYPDIKKLRNHHDNKHLIVYGPLKPPKRVSFSEKVIVHEFREYHECRKCTKIFESYVLLKTHMKENHKKRKCYICYYCNKTFVDRSIFKVHIKLHCDICGDLSPTKLKYNEHRRYICKVYKLYKCTTCDADFYKFMDLKDHTYDHIGDFFICDICKDQFGTKCALAHHIKFLHSKPRPKSLYEMRLLGSDRLYLCNFCDESSVDKTSIERHVELLPDLSNRAMTGYKDYYFCDHCFKQFGTESEMLQHKWTHFLKDNPEHDPAKKNDAVGENNVSNKEKVISLDNKDNTDKEKPETTETTKTTKNNIDTTNEIPITLLPKVVVKRLSTDIIQKINNNVIVTNPLLHEALTNDKKKKTLIETQPEIARTEVEKEKVPSKTPIVNQQTGMSPSQPDESAEEQGVFTVDVAEIITTKKPLVIGRQTILSKHQCEICNRYFSTAFCLRRHVEQVHRDYDNLRCIDCEETFVWPSLLLSHNCLRAPFVEEPFDDARPEILFDNIPRISNDSYENCVDFDIPAPIVELSPEQSGAHLRNGVQSASDKICQYVSTHNAGYKIVVEEVPIEF